MSVALKVSVDRDTPELEAYLEVARNTRPLMAALGKRAEVELRSHFLKKNAVPNKQGWPKSNFWARRIRANTSLTSWTSTTADVTIAAPEMAQKVHGGTIKPKESKYLALPAVAEAKGRSPRVVEGLHFEPRRGRKIKGVLVNDAGVTMYRLATSVTQAADPTALPTEAALGEAMVNETSKFMRRFTARRARRA